MTDRIRLTEDNRRWWTLAAMCFALFMIMLDNTVVNVALPSIQEDLGRHALEPRVDGQRLHADLRRPARDRRPPRRHLRAPADVPLRRRRLRGSRARPSASRPTRTWLVAGRAVQGIGAAFMMPATLSIITNAFPPEERGKAIGTWAGVSGARARDRPGRGRRPHRARLVARDLLPQPAGRRRRRRRDAVRHARVARRDRRARGRPAPASPRLSIGLTALVLALIEGNSWGWGSPEIIALLVDRRRSGSSRSRCIEPRVARADGGLLASSARAPSSARTSSPSSSPSRCSRSSSSSRSTCRTSSATRALEAGVALPALHAC